MCDIAVGRRVLFPEVNRHSARGNFMNFPDYHGIISSACPSAPGVCVYIATVGTATATASLLVYIETASTATPHFEFR